MLHTNTRSITAVVAAGVLLAGCAGSDPVVGDGADGADSAAERAAVAAEPAADDPGTEDDPAPVDEGVAETVSVEVNAEPDPLMGANVRVETAGFRWAPEHASGDAVDGEGHAHLYVDGEKVGRLYGGDVHLQLDPGEHEIRVTLNGNDHEDLVVDGEVVEATTTVTVPERSGGMGGGHDGTEASTRMEVRLVAEPDPRAGVNVRIEAEGFTWAPERASGDHVDGEGHAHLYVDGEKLGRVYGEWLHVALDPGRHELRVTLNGNDHRDYLVDGAPVEATAEVEVPEGDAMR
jgi:hypothetical protein